MKNRKNEEYILFGGQMLLMLGYILPVSFLNFQLPYLLKPILGFFCCCGILVILIALWQLRNFISPFPSPKTNTHLLTKGIFKYSRHPIYTGILISFFSYALFEGNTFKLIITFLLFLLFLIKSGYEERLLSARFNSYDHYKKNTRRFL